MAAEPSTDVESLLRSALRPIEPPEKLSGRLEETLSAVTEAAAEELSAWAEELSESEDRKSTRLNSSHPSISYAVFCLKKKKKDQRHQRRADLAARYRRGMCHR